MEIARLAGPRADLPPNNHWHILPLVAAHRLMIGQEYFCYQGYHCYMLSNRESETTVWDGLKGGLHVNFVVKPSLVGTIMLHLFARLGLGELFFRATTMSGRLVYTATWPTDRDFRLHNLLRGLREAMLRSNLMRSAHIIKVLGTAGTLKLNTMVWSSRRGKGEFARSLLATTKRLLRKKDPRAIALANVVPSR